MSEINPIPESISHKKLNAILLKAKENNLTPFEKGQGVPDEKDSLQDLLEEWSQLSQDLLSNLNNKQILSTHTKEETSIKALGAMEAYINMAMQAFRASKQEG